MVKKVKAVPHGEVQPDIEPDHARDEEVRRKALGDAWSDVQDMLKVAETDSERALLEGAANRIQFRATGVQSPEADKEQFKSDFRATNPSLHMLYTKAAVRHIALMESMIRELADESNVNLIDPIQALRGAIRALVRDNAAYAEAQDLLGRLVQAGFAVRSHAELLPHADASDD